MRSSSTSWVAAIWRMSAHVPNCGSISWYVRGRSRGRQTTGTAAGCGPREQPVERPRKQRAKRPEAPTQGIGIGQQLRAGTQRAALQPTKACPPGSRVTMVGPSSAQRPLPARGRRPSSLNGIGSLISPTKASWALPS